MRVANVPSATELRPQVNSSQKQLEVPPGERDERLFFQIDVRESEPSVDSMGGIERLIWAPSRYCGRPRARTSQRLAADSKGILGELQRGDRNE
jgi:hypothetical protein